MATKPELSGALDKQVGGNHYKKGIQPFHLSYANGHDGCIHAMTKYMTRHRRKDPEKGYEDCQKAHHITGIRLDLISLVGEPAPPPRPRLPIQDYVEANELVTQDAVAVYAIEAWHERWNAGSATRQGATHEMWHNNIRSLIRAAAQAAYPEFYNEKDFV